MRRLPHSKYNSTLECYTFNLPAVVTCDRCCPYCYARKGRFLAPGVAESHDLNWVATQDLDTFMDTMNAELTTIESLGCAEYRIHSAGDMYSLDYLNAWVELAKSHSTLRFFTYTKRWTDPSWLTALRQAMIDAPNLTIRLSQDWITGPAPKGWLTATVLPKGQESQSTCLKQTHKSVEKTLPDGRKVHLDGKACHTCGRCMSHLVMNVNFSQH